MGMSVKLTIDSSGNGHHLGWEKRIGGHFKNDLHSKFSLSITGLQIPDSHGFNGTLGWPVMNYIRIYVEILKQ